MKITIRLKQNQEFVTLTRAMDRGYHPEGFAPIDAAPVNRVGDQEHHRTTSTNTDKKKEKEEKKRKWAEGKTNENE